MTSRLYTLPAMPTALAIGWKAGPVLTIRNSQDAMLPLRMLNKGERTALLAQLLQCSFNLLLSRGKLKISCRILVFDKKGVSKGMIVLAAPEQL